MFSSSRPYRTRGDGGGGSRGCAALHPGLFSLRPYRTTRAVSQVSNFRRPGAPTIPGSGERVKARTTADPSTACGSGRHGEDQFVVSHHNAKNEDVVRMGHSLFVLWERGQRQEPLPGRRTPSSSEELLLPRLGHLRSQELLEVHACHHGWLGSMFRSFAR